MSRHRQAASAVLAAAWLLALPLSACAQSDAKNPLPKILVAPGGRTFATEDGRPFVPMGVNYFRPGTGWAPQLWKKWDLDAMRRDFVAMKASGVNCIRVFVSYGSFFWDGENLLPEGLDKFDQLLTLCGETGIYLHPTGPDRWEGCPDWAKADPIADPAALTAVEIFWRKFAARYRGRTAIFAYDLLNEPFASFDTEAAKTQWNAWLQTQYGSAQKTAEAWGVAPETIPWGQQPLPPLKDAPGDRQLLDFQHFREYLADEWTRRQVEAIKSVDPKSLVTVGLLQWSVPAELCSVRYYVAFRPERQAKFLDFLDVHFYPQQINEFTEERVQRNLACLESVVREMAAPGKPVVVAEFGWYGGGKLELKDQTFGVVTEEQQAQWGRSLVETSRGFATGWLNWGLYDHPEALDCTQRIGLMTVDGKTKVWGKEFSRLMKAYAGQPMPPPAIGPRPTLDWERSLTDSAVTRKFADDYFKAFQAERGQAVHPKE